MCSWSFTESNWFLYLAVSGSCVVVSYHYSNWAISSAYHLVAFGWSYFLNTEDMVLGIRTRGRMMVCADGSNKLWRPPKILILLKFESKRVWPDWVIYRIFKAFGNKSPTFLGNFCKGIKIFNFSSEIIFGNFNRHLAIFYWSHWSKQKCRVPLIEIGFAYLERICFLPEKVAVLTKLGCFTNVLNLFLYWYLKSSKLPLNLPSCAGIFHKRLNQHN